MSSQMSALTLVMVWGISAGKVSARRKERIVTAHVSPRKPLSVAVEWPCHDDHNVFFLISLTKPHRTQNSNFFPSLLRDVKKKVVSREAVCFAGFFMCLCARIHIYLAILNFRSHTRGMHSENLCSRHNSVKTEKKTKHTVSQRFHVRKDESLAHACVSILPTWKHASIFNSMVV